MPFELFRLPFELREMIYKAMFETSSQDNIITPDQNYTRRRFTGRDLNDHTISNGLGFLQTCQQAYEEAYPCLYKPENTYYFEDVQHGADTVYLEPDSKCARYGKRQELECQGWIPCRRQLKLPQCDFVAMPTWLEKIGERNRMQVRHIQLHFNGLDFTRYGDRMNLESPQPYVGGEYIAAALNILAKAHSLESFTVSFADPPQDPFGWDEWEPVLLAIDHIFIGYSTTHESIPSLGFAAKLRLLQGVKNVVFKGANLDAGCQPFDSACREDFYEGMQIGQSCEYWFMLMMPSCLEDLKERMEAGHDSKDKTNLQFSWSKTCVDQYEHLLWSRPCLKLQFSRISSRRAYKRMRLC